MGKIRQRRAPNAKSSAKGDASTGISLQKSGDDGHKALSHQSDPNALQLLIYFIKVLLLSLLSIPFWFLTGILSLIYGRPPKMVFLSQTRRFIRYAIQSGELSSLAKADLILTILVHTATSRVSGFCWLFDEILYGRRLNSLSIQKPLFVMSAYRSASTEMARTLAKDVNRFVAPNAIMCAFPYLWLWNLVSWVVGDDSGITVEEANGYLNKNFSKESLERHDNDHFAIDTFDGYFLSSHLNGISFQLGTDVIVKEFNSAKFEEHNRYLFEHCFVEHVDRIARKTLLYNGIASVSDKTFLLKGHFLQSANALQRKYPDAYFLTVLRDPLDRLKSGINHMAVNNTLWQGKSPNWKSLSKAFAKIEKEYCDLEMEWYSNENETKRLSIRFEDFIKNSKKTINRIYLDLLESSSDDIRLSSIPEKGKKVYTINRSLQDLGIDEALLKQELTDYYAWMKKQ